MSETLFNKVAGVQSATLSEKRFQHRCFPMNFEKILGTLIFNTNYERLLLLFVILSSAVKLFSTFGFFSPFLTIRTSRPEVFIGKGVLKMCSKFTGEHPCRSVISIKLQSNFIEIALRHGCSPVNLLHIFRTSFLKNTCDGCFRIIYFDRIKVQHLLVNVTIQYVPCLLYECTHSKILKNSNDYLFCQSAIHQCH